MLHKIVTQIPDFYITCTHFEGSTCDMNRQNKCITCEAVSELFVGLWGWVGVGGAWNATCCSHVR